MHGCPETLMSVLNTDECHDKMITCKLPFNALSFLQSYTLQEAKLSLFPEQKTVFRAIFWIFA